MQNLMDSMDSTEGLRQKPGQSLKDFIELIESHYIQLQSKECTNENFIQEKKEALWFGLDLELWELVDSVLNVQDNIQLDDQMIPVSWEELVETAQDAEWLVKLKKEKESPSCYDGNEHFTVSTEDPSFNRDADGYVRIYIGGSAGIWFGRGHPLNIQNEGSYLSASTRLSSNDDVQLRDCVGQTVEAINIAKRYGIIHLRILCDSELLIKFMNDWAFSWLANGWHRENGIKVPAEIRESLRNLLQAQHGIPVQWIYCLNHELIASLPSNTI